MRVREFTDPTEIHSEMPLLDPISAAQAVPQIRIFSIQNAYRLKYLFLNASKSLRLKIRIQMKIFLRSGGAFGDHFRPPNGSKTLRRRSSMEAGAILGAQNPLSSIIAFPKRLRATSTHKIRIQMKIFVTSGGAKWPPKAPPEGRKILIWIRILRVEVDLRRLGKDIMRDKRP